MGGIICIIVEMLLPTVGLLAGLDVAAMLYSVVLALGGDIQAMYAMLISFAAAIVMFALIVKRLPSSKLWNKVVLKDESRSERGYISAAPRESLLGASGEVLTELRPAGSVRLNGKPVDVVSEGAFIPKGAQVQVVAVEGNRVVVRQV
jgi:membrane-bound serine protease (ClpP class)